MWFAWNQGRPDLVNEILASLSMSDVSRWLAWLSIDGPELNADRRAGITCSTIANWNGFTKPQDVLTPSVFFPSLKAEEEAANEQSPEEIEAHFRQFARRHNSSEARRSKRNKPKNQKGRRP